MRAADIMTTGLLTLAPDMSIAQADRMLAARGISGAPCSMRRAGSSAS